MRLVILLSGSGTTAQALLDAVADGRIPAEIVAVGADKDCAGLERARAAGVEDFLVAPSSYSDRPSWNRALQSAVAEREPDLVILAGFMRILDAQFVAAFADRLINTHPALLPSFPGAHGVRDALAAGVAQTGASVIVVDSGVDTGPVLAQERVPVLPDDTEHTLHERIKPVERRLLIDVVRGIAEGSIELGSASTP